MKKRIPALNINTSEERGIALVMVTIALFATAGMLAALLILAGDKGKMAAIGANALSLESFAHGTLASCSEIIDAARDSSSPLTNIENTIGPIITYVADPDFLAEITGPGNWLQDVVTGTFVADFVAVYGGYVASLDVDLINDSGDETNARGQVFFEDDYLNEKNEGDATTGDPSQYTTYRCTVFAQDQASNRQITLYSYIRI